MVYITYYMSPIGKLLLASKNNKLVGVWMEKQKYYFAIPKEEIKENNDLEIFVNTKKWLDRYFKKENPNVNELDIEFLGSDFRKKVWQQVLAIPYGKTITYKEIAKKIACVYSYKQMSAQAVGSSLGHNPLLIIVPCHRVVGTNKTLKGYAGGLAKKKYLLELEGVDIESFKNA